LFIHFLDPIPEILIEETPKEPEKEKTDEDLLPSELRNILNDDSKVYSYNLHINRKSSSS
jgi:hypothetical protein